MAQPNSRPSFDDLIANYPTPEAYSPGTLKRAIGGAVDDTRAPPGPGQWLGGESGDTCTIRMSRTLNRSGVRIPDRFPGFHTVKGRDGFSYGFRVQELHKWLIGRFGPPDIIVRGKPVSRDAFAGKRGIIVFDIVFGRNEDGVTRALGHADLWDGSVFFDQRAGLSPRDPNDPLDFFHRADAVSLWICPGTATIPPA